MEATQNKTLKQLLTEIGTYCYDHGDYCVIQNTIKEKEIQKFLDCYVPGTEILKDGKNGTSVALRGKAEEQKGATGEEELSCHGFLLYDLSGQTGEWVIAPFESLEKLEDHILSDAGYLNVYCTDMLAIIDGEIKPFEIHFEGNNDKTIVLDKDIIDNDFDLKAMRPKLSLHWITEEELASENE